VLHWVLKQLSAVAGIVASLTFLRNMSSNWSPAAQFWVQAVEGLGIFFFVLQLPFTFAMVRLDFDLRWYVVTDRSLRIRSGVLRIREMTMTFANIQNIAVRQGPLQRWLGLYDLTVRTAGGGSGSDEGHDNGQHRSAAHIGHFQGVDNAPAIRDLIVNRMKRARDAGLGDTDDVADAEPPASSDPDPGGLRAALAELHSEAVSLRSMLEHH
jgi:membrane protein YdbS with pleckstrin-like domain